MNKVVVQGRINDTDQRFLDAVPDVVDSNELVVDLQIGWDPDADNGNVDEDEKGEGAPFDAEDCRPIYGKDGDTVDDDLHESVDLEAPKNDLTLLVNSFEKGGLSTDR